ncbi:MAG: hypothetical protein HW421_874 [Ignavibacteria bacterium]|nr:hypothetical protein [Ignavibacteria bacterium]
MEAKQNSIAKFMQQQDTQFLIPVYQRNYDWRIEHCKQLLFDIVQSGLNDKIESHFIGSIVYLHSGPFISPSKLTIIDGQQRLTTLTLLFASLHQKAKETNNEKLSESIKRKYLINEDLDSTEKIKLRPIKKDDKALTCIINHNFNDFIEFSRIIENYKYFYENIFPETIDIIIKGIQKLAFIEVGLEKGKDDPQKIFQSLNSTGLDLSPADLIRNYILMGLNEKMQNEIYNNYWKPIEDNCLEITSNNSKVSNFIRDYLTFKTNKIPNKDKVYESFKETFIFDNEMFLKNILQDLKNYSEVYCKLINPERESNKSISENIQLINKLQINVSYPFLLQVYKDYIDDKINEPVFIKVLETIQSYVWRRFIVGLPTNALNKIFMDLYSSIEIDNYLKSFQISLLRKKSSGKFPTNDDVFESLYTKDMYYINPKNRTYFLERLENYRCSEKFFIEGNQEFTIEHIFPQNPSKEWEDSLGEEFEIMKKLSNTVSNLTLSVFNKELSNYLFLKKRDLPEKGYKFSKLNLNKLISSFENWNLQSLNDRFDWIKNRFIEIWNFPEIELIEDENSELEINILDLLPSDVTNKSMEYFVFFDNKYPNPSWQLLYKTVSEIMFDREPHMFIATDLSDNLKLTQHQEELFKPLQISQTYFIESNLSAQFIVMRTQKILEKCETDDNLFIKFKE